MTSTQGQLADVVRAPFGRDVIESIIPHRDPFLLVDEVLELEPGVRIVARKTFHEDDWFFEGHFPGRPIVPGVIMVEAVAQASAIAVLVMPEHRGRQPLFAGIDKVRFRRIVSPGEELLLSCEILGGRGPVGKGSVEVRVGEDLALRGSLMFAME
ncbi:MAG: 3-hydroxyacyl-ACP dehydratase FabZ [Gaiellaceae bacterium]